MASKESFSHTFAVCAYKESEYLEECVKSLVNQAVKSKIIIATSTPCPYIENIANKYDIPLFVRDGASDIRDDWNFAYNSADTDWVTIAHQDDKYNEFYVKNMIDRVKKLEAKAKGKDVTMFYTDYMPIKNGEIGKRDINSKIRRFLRIPMKSDGMAKSAFGERLLSALATLYAAHLSHITRKYWENQFSHLSSNSILTGIPS